MDSFAPERQMEVKQHISEALVFFGSSACSEELIRIMRLTAQSTVR